MDIGQFVYHTQHQLILVHRIDMEHIHHSLHSIHRHTQHNREMLYYKDTFHRLQLKRYKHQDRWYQYGHCTRRQYRNHPFRADFQSNQVHIDHNAHQCNPHHKHKSKSEPLLHRTEKRMVLLIHDG